MTLMLKISPETELALNSLAAEQGVAIDTCASRLLDQIAHKSSLNEPPAISGRAAAIERLKTFGKTHGLSLCGITLRELRDEARP